MAGKDPMAYGLRVLNKLASAESLDKLGLRKFAERAVHSGTKTSFQAIGAAQRTFSKVSGSAQGSRPANAKSSGVFDLTPTEDQQMIVEVISEFAAEVLRPGAEEAEKADDTPKEVLAQTTEFGLSLLNIPESLGGLAEERSAVTGVLVAEALSHGDMGQAVACMAPSAVATAISLWGTEGQQQTYLPSFTADVPAAALVVNEPQPLFDPFALQTVAKRSGAGYVINGVKSGAVRGAEAELFVIAADVEGRGPSMILVESNTDGLTVAADPSMGLRAAGLSRLQLVDVEVTQDAILGSVDDYRSMIRLSRLAWAGLALGAATSVLEYVKEYVVTREAFGEPIAYRQAVAFTVADMAIELEGMRLVTLKAASRAEQDVDFAREAALSRRLSTEYGMKIGTDGVQLLGGHGFVKEHPVERWYRDLRAVGVMEGAVLV